MSNKQDLEGILKNLVASVTFERFLIHSETKLQAVKPEANYDKASQEIRQLMQIELPTLEQSGDLTPGDYAYQKGFDYAVELMRQLQREKLK